MRDTGGDLPGGRLEQQLIDAYAEHPTAVEKAIEKITLGHAAGKVRSPWGALKTEIERHRDNPTHETGHGREKAIQRAEQRIRNELLHYERADEVLDELFGPRGTLKAHTSPDLEARMLALWNDLRPLGELTEHEQTERLARWRKQQDGQAA